MSATYKNQEAKSSMVVERHFQEVRRQKSGLKIYKRQLVMGIIIKKTKRTSWKSYSNEASRLRNILTKESTRLIYVKKADGTWTECSEDAVNTLMDAHFPVEEAEMDRMHINEELGKRLSEESLLKEESNGQGFFKSYKSPGPKGVFAAIIQQSLGEIQPWLL